MFITNLKRLSLVFIATICFFTASFAQTDLPNELGTEVQTLGGIGGSGTQFRCYSASSLIVTKQEYEKLLNNKKCSFLRSFEIDFSKHTLINYRVGGDCHMRVSSKIFRNDKTKTHTIEVKNYWGGCRAGGSYFGWNVIKKIPAGYKVALKEIQLDNIRAEVKPQLDSVFAKNLLKPTAIEHIETKEVNLGSCIQMYRQTHFVIKNNDSYLKKIRKDAQNYRCKTYARNLDFQKFSYIGVLIRSGYCRYPKGLKHGITKRDPKKQYVLEISYTDPEGQVCRAQSKYELWLQVPKLRNDFELVFQIAAKPKNS